MGQYTQKNIKVPRFNEDNGFYTTKIRSKLMSKIRSTETKPEQKLRKFLWGLGIRYRKNVKSMPGTPDIVIAKHKIVIFVDGEFWHGFNWEIKKNKIKVNRDYWIPKIEKNMQRDSINNQTYKNNGWTVLRFWEHQIKKEFNICINQILDNMNEENISIY